MKKTLRDRKIAWKRVQDISSPANPPFLFLPCAYDLFRFLSRRILSHPPARTRHLIPANKTPGATDRNLNSRLFAGLNGRSQSSIAGRGRSSYRAVISGGRYGLSIVPISRSVRRVNPARFSIEKQRPIKGGDGEKKAEKRARPERGRRCVARSISRRYRRSYRDERE